MRIFLTGFECVKNFKTRISKDCIATSPGVAPTLSLCTGAGVPTGSFFSPRRRKEICPETLPCHRRESGSDSSRLQLLRQGWLEWVLPIQFTTR